MQRDVTGSGRVEHGRQTPGRSLMRTPRRLTPNGLTVVVITDRKWAARDPADASPAPSPKRASWRAFDSSD